MEQAAPAIADVINNEVCRVDFDNPNFCKGCNPLSCIVDGEPVSVGRTWRERKVADG